MDRRLLPGSPNEPVHASFELAEDQVEPPLLEREHPLIPCWPERCEKAITGTHQPGDGEQAGDDAACVLVVLQVVLDPLPADVFVAGDLEPSSVDGTLDR